MSTPQKSPDTSLRLGAEKEGFKAAARRDGFTRLATWLKWLARRRIYEQAARPDDLDNPSA